MGSGQTVGSLLEKHQFVDQARRHCDEHHATYDSKEDRDGAPLPAWIRAWKACYKSWTRCSARGAASAAVNAR